MVALFSPAWSSPDKHCSCRVRTKVEVSTRHQHAIIHTPRGIDQPWKLIKEADGERTGVPGRTLEKMDDELR